MQKRLPHIQTCGQYLKKNYIGMLTSLKQVCQTTVISDYTLMSSFCVRPFTLYREILVCTFRGFAYVALLIDSHFIC